MDLTIVKESIATASKKVTNGKYNNPNHATNSLNNIEYILSDLENKKSINQENNIVYEHNDIKYDENGVILLNEYNGVKLIIHFLSVIISKTHGHHNDILLALEGGLGYMGIDASDRKEILFTALELADDFTREHQMQIEKSIERQENKRGFPYLKKNYTNIKSDLIKIQNIKKLFWTTTDETDFECIKIYYDKLIAQLFEYFTKDNHRKKLLGLINRYLNMKGIGLNEQKRLLIDSYSKFKLNGLNKLLENTINTKILISDTFIT